MRPDDRDRFNGRAVQPPKAARGPTETARTAGLDGKPVELARTVRKPAEPTAHERKSVEAATAERNVAGTQSARERKCARDESFTGKASWQGAILRFPRSAAADDSDFESRLAEEPDFVQRSTAGRVTNEEIEHGGEWAQDETDANEGAASSWLNEVSADQNLQWLAEAPPRTRGEALRRMSPVERMVFTFLVRLKPLSLLSRIWSLPQKSEAWKWARTGRITGSSTGSAVGQQRKTRVKKVAYSAVYLKFKGNVATVWGSGKEVYATRCYANDLQRVVTECYRAQRRSGAVEASATTVNSPEGGSRVEYSFVFRNQRIPVTDIDADPVVEVRHYGLLIDPWNHWRGVSPDGVIFINGIPCGVLEAKCSFGITSRFVVGLHR